MAGSRPGHNERRPVKIPRQTLFLLGRLVLGGVFLYAGVVKALDVTGFAGQVAAYRLLPYAYNYLIAATLPTVEILCGVLLLLNLRIRPALLVSGGLNLVFMIALSSVLLRGLDIDCGCFDPAGDGSTSPGAALLRDLILMSLIVMTWVSADAAGLRSCRGKR